MATFSTTSFYILLFLAGLCLAEVLSIQNAKHGIGNTITDLTTRVRQGSQAGYNFGIRTGEEQQTELLDIVLVASVDGRLHALNRTSGVPIWSMSSSLNGEVPATLGPLVRTQHPKIDPDLEDENSEDQEVYVIEPQSGEIYVMSKPDAPLQRLPFTMSQLVDMSPFSFSGDDRLFVGRKETALLLVELETGRVKATLDSECPWDPFEDLASENNEDEDLDLDELDGTKPPKSPFKSTEVYIGRTDYHISIRTRPTSGSSKKVPVQKLSFSMYGPNKQDSSLQTMYRRTADDKYIESMPNGKVLSFRANIQNEDNSVSSEAHLLWAQAFSNPVVAVFDVLRTPDRDQPFVLLQPRPRLEDILPRDELSLAAKKDLLPNRDSAYVGLVEETGSLYAMSPDRFPLVIFGDTNRHDQYGVGRSIDPPPDLKWDADGDGGDDRDLPMDIDSITKKLKLKQLCRGGSMDPRCLTGVRPLESSRLSRLLEGAPSVPFPPIPNNPSMPDPVDSAPGTNTSMIPPRGQLPGGEGDGRLGSNSHVYSIVGIFVLTLLSALAWLRLKQRSPALTTKTVLNGVPVGIKNPITPTDGVYMNGLPNAAGDNSNSLPNGDMGQRTPPLATSTGVELSPRIPSGPSTSTIPPASSSTLSVPNTSIPAALPLPPRMSTPPPPYNIRASTPTPQGDGDGEAEGNKDTGKEESWEVVNAASPSSIILPPPTTPKVVEPSLIVSDNILGFGSHGTVVFKGSLQGRAVAVKRLLQDFVTLAAREVTILQESDDHPNVIRYYYQEHHANFLYIALELCPASLADVIERPDLHREISIAFDPKKALRQITSGLRHLHALKIVHRDIKPQNILISHAKKGVGESAGHRMLISDFGLCKKLEVDQTSFLPTAHGAMAAGTVGWRAP
ncbi:hypothetical protein QCA50_013230 [Cerrena zonata]|uniref:non-specific serine/threonine protein kinase n=1 Tax=Cerrena zonata TaxID=2478898 RepID=A0AAW0FX04_9APHY